MPAPFLYRFDNGTHGTRRFRPPEGGGVQRTALHSSAASSPSPSTSSASRCSCCSWPAGHIYLFLGDVQEALMLLGFVFVVMGITLYQERKTERALEALRDLSSPRALVIRDGQQKRIAGPRSGPRRRDRPGRGRPRAGRRGAPVLHQPVGGRVAPDGRIGARPQDRQRRDSRQWASPAATTCPSSSPARWSSRPGHGRGPGTGAARNRQDRQGAPERRNRRDARSRRRRGRSSGNWRSSAWLCVLVVVVYGLTRGDWLQGFLAGIALAMATLPEEFPVVLTIFLALGAWRISRNSVLTRRVRPSRPSARPPSCASTRPAR